MPFRSCYTCTTLVAHTRFPHPEPSILQTKQLTRARANTEYARIHTPFPFMQNDRILLTELCAIEDPILLAACVVNEEDPNRTELLDTVRRIVASRRSQRVLHSLKAASRGGLTKREYTKGKLLNIIASFQRLNQVSCSRKYFFFFFFSFLLFVPLFRAPFFDSSAPFFFISLVLLFAAIGRCCVSPLNSLLFKKSLPPAASSPSFPYFLVAAHEICIVDSQRTPPFHFGRLLLDLSERPTYLLFHEERERRQHDRVCIEREELQDVLLHGREDVFRQRRDEVDQHALECVVVKIRHRLREALEELGTGEEKRGGKGREDVHVHCVVLRLRVCEV